MKWTKWSNHLLNISVRIQPPGWQSAIQPADAPFISSAFIFFSRTWLMVEIYSSGIHTGDKTANVRGHFFLAPHADNFTVPVLHSWYSCFINIEYPVDWIINLSKFKFIDVKKPWYVFWCKASHSKCWNTFWISYGYYWMPFYNIEAISSQLLIFLGKMVVSNHFLSPTEKKTCF